MAAALAAAMRFRRPLALLAGVLIMLSLAYRPARYTYASTGDVALYEAYARQMLELHILPQEYPPLSVAIFVLPRLLLGDHYLLGFMLLAALAGWLTILAVDRCSRGGWSLLLYFALGAWGTLFFRFDIVVVLATVLAFTAASRRCWAVAQALLAAGLALKLYPLLLMPLPLIWQWREERRFPVKAALSGAGFGLLALGGMWLLAPAQLAGMLRYHRDRPLELEAIGASAAWLLGPGDPRFSYGSINFISPHAALVIAAITMAGVVLLAGIYLAFSTGRLRPAAAWALVLLVLLATSKVFSTQFLLWALPFVVLANAETVALRHHDEGRLRAVAFHALWIAICVLTSLIYPVGFTLFAGEIAGQTSPLWLMRLITLRNTLWLIACGLAFRWWVVRPVQAPVAAPGVGAA